MGAERTSSIFVVLAVMLAMVSTPAAAGLSHEHGRAELKIAVDETSVLVELISPAANLLGFEHAPRTSAQWDRARGVIERVHNSTVFQVMDSAGTCARTSAEWSTPLFEPEQLEATASGSAVVEPTPAHRHHHDHGSGQGHHPGSEHDGHADVLVLLTFECATRPLTLQHRLFERFPALNDLRVSLVTPAEQRGLRQHPGSPARIDL